MADEAHEETDALLDSLERRIRREYTRAAVELQAKMEAFMQKYEGDRVEMMARAAAGDVTEKQLQKWRKEYSLKEQWFENMIDTLSQDLVSADRKAASIVNGYTPDAYVINANFGAYQVESQGMVDTSFTLYDRATVERLLRDEPDLLPRVEVDESKDGRWNRQKVSSSVLQSILQGESVTDAARRLRGVVDMDFRSAMRSARTAMTGAQNAGRIDSYRRAQGMGIELRQEWLATLDHRTRHSHRRLDGERVEVGEKFSNGLKYPGDPDGGRGSEIYNCRCTLVPVVEGVDQSDAPRNSKLGNMSYEEWKNEKGSKQEAEVRPTSHKVVQGADIVGVWRRREDEFEFEIEDVMSAQGYDGVPRLVDADEFDELVMKANGGKGFIAQRSYTGTNKEVADEYRRMLYEGKWYVDCSTGGAQYGQGMYCAADYTGKLTYGIKSEMDHYTALGQERCKGVGFHGLTDDRKMELIRESAKKIASGDDVESVITMMRFELQVGNVEFSEATEAHRIAEKYDYMGEVARLRTYVDNAVTHVETITLDPSARVITYKEIMRMYNDEEIREFGMNFDNVGSYAAAKGYDVINAEGHGDSGSYTVILNRTKLIIKRPEGWE